MHHQLLSEDERGQQQKGLLFARVAGIVVCTLILGLFVITLPTYFARLQQYCTESCSYLQLSVHNIQSLHRFNLSLNAYAVVIVTLLIISGLLCVAVATLLLWRRSDNWIALLIAFLLVVLGLGSTTIDASVLQPLFGPKLGLFLANFSNFLGAVSLPLLFSLFPNGRFVPRWTRWVLIALIILAIMLTFVPFILSVPIVIPTLSFFIYSICLLSLVLAQIYRYRRVSTPVEQQQTKWVIFGFSLAALITFGLLIPEHITLPFSQPDSPYVIIANLIQTLSLTVPIALCFGIAILRYRLWDIDILINRTLVYGSLTIILALVYFLSVFALQALLSVFTGHLSSGAQTPVVIVASTLGIAALFQPLRRRIQTIIDRRFYRSKYDAARTLAAFSKTLSSEVDLNQLKENLLAVVQETMQPAHVSLWLRDPDASKGRNTRLLPEIDEEMRRIESNSNL
jgi:hypothetical protein